MCIGEMTEIMKNILLIALGGALGSTLRYLVSKIISGWWANAFPLGTFSVNILGCLLIGFLTGLVAEGLLSQDLKLLLITGFCGGFTTFSTFANESLSLMRPGEILTSALYIGLSVAAGVFAVWMGMKLVH